MNTLSVKDHLNHQRQIRLEQQTQMLKRWIFLIMFHLSWIGFITALLLLPAFSLHITYVNPGLLDVQTMRTLTKNPYQNKVYLAHASLMFKDLIEHPLVKSYKVEPYALGFWELRVVEHQVLAYWLEDQKVLLENGVSYALSESEMQRIQALPLVNGYTDELSSLALSEALILLNDTSFSRISEIIQDSKSYDFSYAHLIMQDGIHIFTALSSMAVLNDYLLIKQALNPEHLCIVIDEITSVPYSFSCTP